MSKIRIEKEFQSAILYELRKHEYNHAFQLVVCREDGKEFDVNVDVKITKGWGCSDGCAPNEFQYYYPDDVVIEGDLTTAELQAIAEIVETKLALAGCEKRSKEE